jgi:hypothetical protein
MSSTTQDSHAQAQATSLRSYLRREVNKIIGHDLATKAMARCSFEKWSKDITEYKDGIKPLKSRLLWVKLGEPPMLKAIEDDLKAMQWPSSGLLELLVARLADTANAEQAMLTSRAKELADYARRDAGMMISFDGELSSSSSMRACGIDVPEQSEHGEFTKFVPTNPDDIEPLFEKLEKDLAELLALG